jgi:hypothetical protein
MKLLANLFIFLPFIFELIQDYYQIEHGKGDEKDRGKGWVDWVIRGALTVFATVIGVLAGYEWWKPFMMCIVIFFVGFNYALNLARGKNIYHLGRDGWDQFEAEYMPGWRGLVVRILVLISGYAIWIS